MAKPGEPEITVLGSERCLIKSINAIYAGQAEKEYMGDQGTVRFSPDYLGVKIKFAHTESGSMRWKDLG